MAILYMDCGEAPQYVNNIEQSISIDSIDFCPGEAVEDAADHFRRWRNK